MAEQNVPERLKARREELGLSQIKAADLIGIRQPHLSRIELAKAVPPPGLAARIAAVYEIDREELVRWATESKIRAFEQKLTGAIGASKDHPIGVFEGEIEAVVNG